MIHRGHYDGWVRTTIKDTDVEAYYTERWGRGFYVEATIIDMMDEDSAAAYLRSSLAKMMANPAD